MNRYDQARLCKCCWKVGGYARSALGIVKIIEVVNILKHIDTNNNSGRGGKSRRQNRGTQGEREG